MMKALVDAMWVDAMRFAPVLCTDATGVKVQAPNECRNGHFFTVVAAERCVLFRYSKKHDKKAVDALFAGFTGVLVRDAHAIYLHFDDEGDITGACCWSHLLEPAGYVRDAKGAAAGVSARRLLPLANLAGEESESARASACALGRHLATLRSHRVA